MRHDTDSEAASIRLDKWLWFARMAKTRSVAAKLCAKGRVIVGTQAAKKPHQLVRVGDVVVVELPREKRTLTVVALGERRGPFAEARLLYDETVPAVVLSDKDGEWSSLFEDEEELSRVSA